jgi:hypothetical protein
MIAFIPILSVISLPLGSIIHKLVFDIADHTSCSFYQRYVMELTNSPAAKISLYATLVFFVYYFFCWVSAFRAVHQIGRVRSFLAVAISISAWAAVSGLIEAPIFRLFWHAFEKKFL